MTRRNRRKNLPNEGEGSRLSTGRERLRRLSSKLWHPVNNASLVFFRVAFGAIMVWEMFRYFAEDRIRRYYIEPKFLFTYLGFDWVKPWPGNGMYIHFAVLGLLGIFVALGLFYRISAALFFLGFTYVFLLDQSNYLNHFYLVALLSWLMMFIPAHQRFSLDVRWRLTPGSKAAPAWGLWLLRAQIGIVYFFGGVAKLNGDWLQGEPLRGWLGARAKMPLVGPLLGQEWLVWVFVYGGLLFDLLVTPALLWRKTRAWALAFSLLFHITNAFLFKIGIFPWFMLLASTLFLDPDWPHRCVRWLSGRKPAVSSTPVGSAALPVPSAAIQRTTGTLIGAYLLLQILIPLRHFLYPGNVSWTEEGHRFSWRMKLRSKESEAKFFVTDKTTGGTQVVDPVSDLNRSQSEEMSSRPDMILQYARHLAAEARLRGATDVEVRAVVKTALNGRAVQLLIDPSVDLAAQPRSLRAAPWIMPLTEPRRRRPERGEPRVRNQK